MPRGLIVAPYGIVPPHEGSKAHTDAHIRQLQGLGHDLWYLGLGLAPGEAAAMHEGWRDRFVHAPYEPWHRRGALPATAWDLARKRLRRALALQPHVDSWYQAQWTPAAARLHEAARFDYVLVHYIFFSRVLEAFPARVRRIIDTHDVFARRYERLAAQGVAVPWWSCSARGEVMALRRGDCVIAGSDADADVFRRGLGAGARVVSVGHPCAWQPLPEPGGPAVGFIGSGNPPNAAGLAWFVERCWPHIRSRLPAAQLLLAGPICGLAGPWSGAPGVTLLGPVADTADFHRLTTVEVNPVFAGSGLKIKTIESLGCGRALVTASEGVAGLDRGYGAFRVADAPEAFAREVVGLLESPGERAGLVAGAGRLIADWNRRQQSALASLFTGL
jgi:hypothetical protein